MNVCMVIGCHPCWQDDYNRAAAIYPDHKICVVNFATELTKADYLATVHGNLIPRFLQAYKHDNPLIVFQRKNHHAIQGYAAVETYSHGGSGPFAAAVMVMLGFDLAIMCGCPVTGEGGYAQESKEHPFSEKTWHQPEHSRIQKWYDGMCEFKENRPEVANKIRSMSGNTKEIFGGIE